MGNSALSIFDRLKMPGNPVANVNSMITHGQARFTLLTPRLIRLEWSPTCQFEDRGTYAFPNRQAEPPAFVQALSGTQLKIRTDYLSLTYINDGNPFNPANLSIQFDLS